MGKLKSDKGVAGLTILLSIVVLLFVIGLLIMIFSIMSGKIADTDTLYVTTDSITVTNETLTQANLKTGDQLVVYGLRDVACSVIAIYNGTSAGGLITATNYTESSECVISNTSSTFSTANWIINYSYTYSEDKYGTVGVINDTTGALSSTTDWFDIFIVISAMVVLILLTVIIITAIRSSGMIASDGMGKPRNVGTA